MYEIKGLVIAVTGTPGSGKSSFAKMLAKRISGSRVLELSYIVDKYKLYSSKDRYGSKIIKTEQLGSTVRKLVRDQKGVSIIVGHIFPELGIRSDITVVTRVGLARLAQRLEARGYQNGKISENLVSEALDYCGQMSKRLSKEIYEIETEQEKKVMIGYIAAKASGRKAKMPATRDISKARDIVALARGKNPYRL